MAHVIFKQMKDVHGVDFSYICWFPQGLRKYPRVFQLSIFYDKFRCQLSNRKYYEFINPRLYRQ